MAVDSVDSVAEVLVFAAVALTVDLNSCFVSFCLDSTCCSKLDLVIFGLVCLPPVALHSLCFGISLALVFFQNVLAAKA